MDHDKRKIRYYYTATPDILKRQYTLLDKNDRDLLEQIASWSKGGGECFLMVDYLTEVILGCGEKAFYRSVYKLQMLGLIEFKRGNRRKPNRYRFVSDPSRWLLTKELRIKIAADHASLGFGELVFEGNAFPNEYGFKLAFNKRYPKYEIKIGNDLATGKPVRVAANLEDEAWLKRIQFLESPHCTDFKVLFDFYSYSLDRLQLAVPQENENLPHKKLYLQSIEKLYSNFAEIGDETPLRKLIALGIELENQGIAGIEIQTILKSRTVRAEDGSVAFIE